jgi:hypothetical protein
MNNKKDIRCFVSSYVPYEYLRDLDLCDPKELKRDIEIYGAEHIFKSSKQYARMLGVSGIMF